MNARVLAGLALLVGLTLAGGTATAADLEWPDGRWLKDGETFYYPDGRWMYSSGTTYFPDGRWMMSSGTLYYPNGRWLVSSGTWYKPDGTWAPKGWIGTFVSIKEGPSSLSVWRESETSPVRVDVIVEHAEYRYEYMSWGDRHGARLWAIGRWIPVFGDQALFEPPPSKGKKHKDKGKWGKDRDRDDDRDDDRDHGRDRDRDDDDDDRDRPRGRTYSLCGYDFEVVDSVRSEKEEVILDTKGVLWVVVLETCKGGKIASDVEDFLILENGWTMYLHETGNAWLLAGGTYFHVGGDVRTIKGGRKNKFETKLEEGGWIKYSKPDLVDGSLRLHDDTAKREIWLTGKDTFRWGW